MKKSLEKRNGRKKDEEALNNDASPMETNISGSLEDIPLTGDYFLVDEILLGLHTPYRIIKVVNLKKFRFEKSTGKIVQQQNQEDPNYKRQPIESRH
jgi:hypothetical protein